MNWVTAQSPVLTVGAVLASKVLYSEFMFRAYLALIGLAATTSLQSAPTTVDLVARSANPCDVNGAPIAPELGSEFFVSLNFDIVGNLEGSYKVTFAGAYEKSETPSLTLGNGAPGNYQVIWGPFKSLTATPTQFTVSLVPTTRFRETTKRNNSLKFTLQPDLPETAIESYSPRQLTGSLSLDLRFNPVALPENLQVWFPGVANQTFQSVLGQTIANGLSSDSDGSPFVGTPNLINGAISINSQISTVALAQRTNPHLLRSAQPAVSGLQAQWLLSETYAPATDRNIVKFAQSAVKRQSTNYDKTRSIYLSVLKTIKYVHTNGNLPSATLTLKSKKGDCGGMSSLFVSACRSIGIPARAVVGFTEGADQWHVWAEVFIEGAGWVACDPAYGDALSPDGKLDVYFGVIPDLNKRIATSFGFDVYSGTDFKPLLQAPSAFWSNSNAVLLSGSSHSSLAVTQTL